VANHKRKIRHSFLFRDPAIERVIPADTAASVIADKILGSGNNPWPNFEVRKPRGP